MGPIPDEDAGTVSYEMCILVSRVLPGSHTRFSFGSEEFEGPGDSHEERNRIDSGPTGYADWVWDNTGDTRHTDVRPEVGETRSRDHLPRSPSRKYLLSTSHSRTQSGEHNLLQEYSQVSEGRGPLPVSKPPVSKVRTGSLPGGRYGRVRSGNPRDKTGGSQGGVEGGGRRVDGPLPYGYVTPSTVRVGGGGLSERDRGLS